MDFRNFKFCLLALLAHSNAVALSENRHPIHLVPPLYVSENQLRTLSNQFERGVLSGRKLLVLVYGGNKDGIATQVVPIDKWGLDSQSFWLNHDGKFMDLGTVHLNTTYNELVGDESVRLSKRLWLTIAQVQAMTIHCQNERTRTNDRASIVFSVRTSQGVQFRMATSPSKPYGTVMCVTNTGAIQEANLSLLPTTKSWMDHFGPNSRMRKPPHSN